MSASPQATATPAGPAPAPAVRSSYRIVTVRQVRVLTPRMARVTFTGDDLRDTVDAGPDQYLKIFFPLEGQARPTLPPEISGDDRMSWYRTYLTMPDETRPPMRTYTVRAMRPEVGELDVDFVLHDDGDRTGGGHGGPASRWARNAKAGDEVALMGPFGMYAVSTDVDWHLVVGDESAIPAIAAIVEGLAPGTVLRGFVEIADERERQLFASRGDVDLQWVVRGVSAHGDELLAALRTAELPAGPAYAWLAGEATVVKYARRHLVSERGIDKRNISFTGYWRQGKSEEDASRENVLGGTTANSAAVESEA